MKWSLGQRTRPYSKAYGPIWRSSRRLPYAEAVFNQQFPRLYCLVVIFAYVSRVPRPPPTVLNALLLRQDVTSSLILKLKHKHVFAGSLLNRYVNTFVTYFHSFIFW